MIKHTLALTILTTFLAGCQSLGIDQGYGWTGQGAKPFDGAKAACEAKVGADEGSQAFYDCMKEKGWTRT